MNQNAQPNIEYLQLMKLFFEVGDCMKGQKLNGHSKWLYDTEVLASKLFNHIGTLHYLLQGTHLTLPGKKQRIYYDHSSISVVVRAAFETFLTYYYLFCDPSSSPEERKFRYIIWKISGLVDRQNFSMVRKENITKLRSEKRVLDKLIAQTESSSVFFAPNEKSKKAAREGKWRYKKTWPDLSAVAGFNKTVFRDVYNYLCSYAHSGGLSALQIGQAINISDQKGLTTISCQYGLILMSHFIFSFSELFPRARKLLNKNEETKELAVKWYITWKEEAFIKPFSHNQALAANAKKPRG